MKALITGSNGFLGRHFRHALRKPEWETVGCDIASPHAPLDALLLFQMETERFDLIIHCAAYVGGRAAIEDGSVAQAVNLELDAAMFRFAVRTKARHVLYISSSAVYPVSLQRRRGISLQEDMVELDNPSLPDELYGWSKLTGEMLAERARSDVPVTVVRPFSGYGTDQDVTYPFRAFTDRARRRDDPFVIWGSGEQTRDFVHVDDIVDACLELTEIGWPEPVNIGTGRPVTMRELATMVCREAGYTPEFHIQDMMPAGVNYRVADTTRMSRFYLPKVSLEEGIRRALQ